MRSTSVPSGWADFNGRRGGWGWGGVGGVKARKREQTWSPEVTMPACAGAWGSVRGVFAVGGFYISSPVRARVEARAPPARPPPPPRAPPPAPPARVAAPARARVAPPPPPRAPPPRRPPPPPPPRPPVLRF